MKIEREIPSLIAFKVTKQEYLKIYNFFGRNGSPLSPAIKGVLIDYINAHEERDTPEISKVKSMCRELIEILRRK